MNLTVRPYQNEEDFWRMRAFLRQVFLLNNRLERCWHVARLEYARWHMIANCAKLRLEDVAYLWQNGDELAAFMLPDGELGEVHFCVHPTYDSPQLAEEMIGLAEERLTTPRKIGGRRLFAWVNQADAARQELLARRGYTPDDWPEHQWRRDLDSPIPAGLPPAGYQIRALGDGLELLERCYASGLGFHEGDIQIAVENRDDPSWYRSIQRAALYRRDLDLVAVAADGAIAAFCTIWFDDVTRSGYFEPVATVPSHQRRGLGRALLTEGLRRLQQIGCTRAFVGGYTPAANGLYQAVFGPDHELYTPWLRVWE